MNTSLPTSGLFGPRPFLARLEGYVPGEQPHEPGWIKLNTNEFPYPAAPEVLEAVAREAADTVRVYPDAAATPLRRALAERHGVEPENILVGNGSDEILRYLAHAFLANGRRAAVTRPTYTLYEVLAEMFEAQVDVHELIDSEKLPPSLSQGGWSVCFIANPNAQIGTLWRGEQILEIAAAGGLVVMDGAYTDFIDVPAGQPREPLPVRETLAATPNIIFTRTFSKSFGLAGMRIGYMIARPELIAEFDKIRDSYNVNRVSQAAALGALAAERSYYRPKCDEIIASRKKLAVELTARGFRAHDGQGNFLFARHAAAPRIYAALKERRILVRYFNHSGLQDGLRITVGTPRENAALTVALDAILPALG